MEVKIVCESKPSDVSVTITHCYYDKDGYLKEDRRDRKGTFVEIMGKMIIEDKSYPGIEALGKAWYDGDWRKDRRTATTDRRGVKKSES